MAVCRIFSPFLFVNEQLMIQHDLLDEIMKLTEGVGKGIRKVYFIVCAFESVLEGELVVFLSREDAWLHLILFSGLVIIGVVCTIVAGLLT